MSDNDFEERYGALRELIQKEIQGLPPEFAKARIKQYLENIAELFISLPVEDLTQRFSEIFLGNAKPEITEKPENVETKRVQKAVVMTAKIPDKLFDTSQNSVFKNNTPVHVYVGPGQEKGKTAIKVNTIVTLNYDKLLELVQIDNPQILLNPEAKVIHDAVISIYHAGNRYFDWSMIYQVKTAYRQEHPRITQQEQQTQTELLNRLITARVTIDTSEEAQYFGYSGGNEENYLIPAKREEFYKNGRKISGFIFLDEPPLLKYCRLARQIDAKDINLLALPDSQEQKINASMQTLVIRDYLFERIVKMLNPKNHMENVIKLDTVFNYIGLEATSRVKKMRIMQTIRALLNNWQAKRLITGFREITERSSGTITKIEIILPESTAKKFKG